MADNFTTDTLEYETQFGTIKALNCHFKTDKAQAFALSCIKIDDSIYTLLRNSSGLILFKGEMLTSIGLMSSTLMIMCCYALRMMHSTIK